MNHRKCTLQDSPTFDSQNYANYQATLRGTNCSVLHGTPLRSLGPILVRQINSLDNLPAFLFAEKACKKQRSNKRRRTQQWCISYAPVSTKHRKRMPSQLTVCFLALPKCSHPLPLRGSFSRKLTVGVHRHENFSPLLCDRTRIQDLPSHSERPMADESFKHSWKVGECWWFTTEYERKSNWTKQISLRSSILCCLIHSFLLEPKA